MSTRGIDVRALAEAAGEVGQLVNGDGAELRLVSVDGRNGRVELELDVSAAGCADCVLPPARLLEVVEAALQRRIPGLYDVIVIDPRVPEEEAIASQIQCGTTTDLWTLVSPTATIAGGNTSPGAVAGNLKGMTVGFRVDVLWRSWDWVVDEWSTALQQLGVNTAIWRRVQGLDGDAGAIQKAEFASFLESVDVAVVGLGNCGSCTSWTIKDAVAALNGGLPTVAATTAQFEQLGRTLAGHYGRPGLRLQVLPYPLDTRPEQEVRAIAADAFEPMLKLIGAVV